MTLTLHTGDALTVLRGLPSASVHLCVTSPPYHGQRDYKVAGQIGLEAMWEEHLAALLAIFREVKRVLRPDGSLWLNYGDRYTGGGNGGGGSFATTGIRQPEPGTEKNVRFANPEALGLPPKNLMGLPWRLVMALQAPEGGGWYWRAYCPWVKRNGMPDSAGDRPGMNLEHLFLLTPGPRYFYDPEAVRRAYAPATVARADDSQIDYAAPGQAAVGIKRSITHPGRAWRMGDPWVDSVRGIVGCGHTDTANGDWRGSRFDTGKTGAPERGGDRAQKQEHRDKQAGHGRRVAGFNERWDAAEAAGRVQAGPKSTATGGMVLNEVGDPLGLYLATQGFKDAHFATFPEELVRPLILSGTSEKGCCPACGAPWERVVESTKSFESGSGKSGNPINGKLGPKVQGGGDTGDIRKGPVLHTQTTGWAPTCKCGLHVEPAPCTVLDPFSGAGTTLLVADRLGRHGVGIELNPEYVAMARRRLANEAPLFHAAGEGK